MFNEVDSLEMDQQGLPMPEFGWVAAHPEINMLSLIRILSHSAAMRPLIA